MLPWLLQSQGILLVYDVTSMSSFQTLLMWMQTLKEVITGVNYVHFLLFFTLYKRLLGLGANIDIIDSFNYSIPSVAIVQCHVS